MSRRKARRQRRRGKVPDEGNPQPTPPTPPQPNPTPTPPTPPNPTPPNPAPPTAAGPSQADIDAAVAKALGVPLDQAKKALADAEKARKAQMSEAERLQAEAAEAVAKSQAEAATAAKATHDAQVTIALVRAGVHPDKLEWCQRLISHVPVGSDEKAITEAIAAAKTAVPEMFAGTSNGPVPPPPGGQPPPPSNPPGSPPAPKPTPDVKQKAAALIAERFPNLGGDKK